jgi:hypothetical protein
MCIRREILNSLEAIAIGKKETKESGAAASEGWNPKNNISRRDFKISCLAGVAGVDFPLYIT